MSPSVDNKTNGHANGSANGTKDVSDPSLDFELGEIDEETMNSGAEGYVVMARLHHDS
jgi:hypothetical protein